MTFLLHLLLRYMFQVSDRVRHWMRFLLFFSWYSMAALRLEASIRAVCCSTSVLPTLGRSIPSVVKPTLSSGTQKNHAGQKDHQIIHKHNITSVWVAGTRLAKVTLQWDEMDLRGVRLLSVKSTTVKSTQMRWKWFTVLWFYLDGLWCLVLWSLRCICVPDRSSSGCSNTRRCCRTTLTERRGRNTKKHRWTFRLQDSFWTHS